MRSRAPAASVSSSSARPRASSSTRILPSSSCRFASPASRRASTSLRRAARRARSSVAIAACRPASSSPSFAARSAAVACSASGRRRLRTSASTSRARSTCVATRASFSSARWRRRLKRPRPAASSTSSRRSDGLAPSTDSTLPCEMTELQPAAEADVGEQLDQVDAAHGGAVDEVLPLAAAMQPPRDRDLGERQVGPGAVLVVEEQLDLAELDGLARRRAGEEHVVGLLGAQLVRAERAGGPEDRVGDVRLAGAVRPDHDGDPGLEAHLGRVDERLEAAEVDRFQVHARPRLSSGADAAAAAARSCVRTERSSADAASPASGRARGG